MKKEKGITLIALIITIIIMLILVTVTINVALNGGLFTKAKEATFKTEIQQIKEQVTIKKAEQYADNIINGTTGYNITIDNLDISQELKDKYRNKLSVSQEGILQYNEENCMTEEKAYLTSIGIQAGTVQENGPTLLYKKAYQTENFETQGGIQVCFLENSDICIFNMVLELSLNGIRFSKYRIEDNVIYIESWVNLIEKGILSNVEEGMVITNDGIQINSTKDDSFFVLNVTNNNRFEDYVPDLNMFNDLYNGLYKSDENKYIQIRCYDLDLNQVNIDIEDGISQGISLGETEEGFIEVLNNKGIEIVDLKTIRYDGHNYKLMEYDSTNGIFVESQNT